MAGHHPVPESSSLVSLNCTEELEDQEIKKRQKQLDPICVQRQLRELDELKGFMDLGFDFSNPEEISPRLKEVVPALKTLPSPRHSDDHRFDLEVITSPTANDAVVKKYLKKWAKSVAVKAVNTSD